MRDAQSILSGRDVTAWAVGTLQDALAWTPTGRVGSERLIQLLVRAAVAMRSLSAMVAEARGVPSWETVRQALRSVLPPRPEDLLPATTRALHRRLPKGLKRRPRTCAIDWHLRPYYGRRTAGVCRSQPKASTRYFFAYATLLVIRRGQTFTVGLSHVEPGEAQSVVIERLLAQAAQAGIQVRRLLLDRGFYGAATIQWLQQHNRPFIMPMLRRGQAGRTKATSTGTQRFFVRNRRGWDRYTWTTPRRTTRPQSPGGITVTVDVCMAPRPRGRGRRTEPLVHACHGVRMAPDAVRTLYRKRFRIETSYRQLGESLAATSSTNRVYRLLLVAIALVLRNLWVWVHWQLVAERTPHGRQRQLHRLRFRQLLAWILGRLDVLLAFPPRQLNLNTAAE